MRNDILARTSRPFRQWTFGFAAILAVCLFTVNLIVEPTFVTSGNLPQALANLAPFAIVAMASVPSIVSGGLDFSVGPTLSLSNVVLVAVLMPHGLGNPWVAVPILITLGAVVGGISGVIITYARIPAVITGLGALFVVGGIGQQILPDPKASSLSWAAHLGGKVGPVPGGLITIAVPLIVWLLLRRTVFVRAMYSIGGDAPTAFASGINVGVIRIVAYAIGGAFAAIAGIALTGFLSSADSSLGLQYALIALAAVSLGGTPIGGGRGGLVGALLGAICIYLIQNFLSAVNVSSEWLDVVYGTVLMLAVMVSARLARVDGVPA